MYGETAIIVVHVEGNKKFFASCANEKLALSFIADHDRVIHRIFEMDEHGNTQEMDVALKNRRLQLIKKKGDPEEAKA